MNLIFFGFLEIAILGHGESIFPFLVLEELNGEINVNETAEFTV